MSAARNMLRLACALLLLSAVAMLLVAVSLSPDTMSWLRADHRWIGEPMNRLEALAPGIDLVHVLLFIAIAMPLALLWRRARWWVVALVLLALAVGSELLQFAIPGRSPLVLDVRDDLLGAGVGLAVGLLMRRLWSPHGIGPAVAESPASPREA